MHIVFYSSILFARKSADAVIGLEVKSLAEHGVLFCAHSIHKNKNPGDKKEYRCQIIGIPEPKVLREEEAHELQKHLYDICSRRGVPCQKTITDVTASNGNSNNNNNYFKIIIPRNFESKCLI